MRSVVGHRLLRLLLCLAALAGLVLRNPARAAEGPEVVDRELSAGVRAGMVLNFIRFAEWPDSVFEEPQSPLVATIIGDDDMADILAVVTAGETAGSSYHPIEVERVGTPRSGGAGLERIAESVRRSHLVFIGRSADPWRKWILDRTAHSPVLTVGDGAGFARGGGMIGLVLVDGRMAFEAHPERIAASGVSVSSKVLRLARIVGSKG